MHDLTSTLSLGLFTSLGVAASLALWIRPCAAEQPAPRDPSLSSISDALGDIPPPPPLAELALLRTRGPAGLDDLLGRYERAVAHRDHAGWEAAVDFVAGQRYATRSRLYWYTDLALAEAEARRTHRPILALRMLGDLREDLSCANSRLFRATLYANLEVSALLRSQFVLYWSSERPVPKVTIDFGDGRQLLRTTTGNSVHYVLDEDGHVLDALPGLYAPSVFRAELIAARALADRVRGVPDAVRIAAVTRHHETGLADVEKRWAQANGTRYAIGEQFLVNQASLIAAQRATVSKAIIETPDLKSTGMVRAGQIDGAFAFDAWSAVGQKLWNFAIPASETPYATPPSVVLDAASRALIAQIHNAGPVSPVTSAALGAVIARLEKSIVGDTALDELRLRPQIRRWIVEHPGAPLDALNAWTYASVFSTPGSDPWLGLLPRTDFSGLPGDGAVKR